MKCSLFLLLLTVILVFTNVLTDAVNETKAGKETDKSSEEDNFQIIHAGRVLAKLTLGCKMYNVDPCTEENIEEASKKGNFPKDFFERLEHTSIRRLNFEKQKVTLQTEDSTTEMDTTKTETKTN